MPSIWNGRVRVILASLLVGLALALVWPSSRVFLLKRLGAAQPGIDQVGGVRLIYEIEAPPGQSTTGLSGRVMAALQRRVDPRGMMRNILWRPVSDTRLEIDIALPPEARGLPKIRMAFIHTQEALDATNISRYAVVDAVEHLTATARQQRLSELAMGSKTRASLLAQASDAFDHIQALKANPDNLPPEALAIKLQPLIAAYELIEAQIEGTNLPAVSLEAMLDQAGSDSRDQKQAGQAWLDDLNKESADFPLRLKAMDEFERRYQEYEALRLKVTDVAELKRMLQGSGVLGFYVLADSLTVPDESQLKAIYARLAPSGKGPMPQPGDTMRWMEVCRVEEFDRPGQSPQTHEWNGKHYMPVLVTPQASMTMASGNWGLETAYPTADSNSGRAIVFQFDAAGKRMFGDLTSYWYEFAQRRGGQYQDARVRLAIVLDDKVISAPVLNSPIKGGSGVIAAGGGAGFSAADADYLINTLNAGSLPAPLSKDPISEECIEPASTK
jgi:hypothetical protein